MKQFFGFKKIIMVFPLLTIFLSPVLADSQWDISLNVPFYVGLESDDSDVGEFSEYLFLLPDVKWNYYFGSEKLHLGVGCRVWTLLIESVMYPIVSLESNLGNFVLNANVGGGAFFMFGLLNCIVPGLLIIPDFSVAYRLGKKKEVSLGAGVTLFLSPPFCDVSFMGSGFLRFTY